MSDEFLTGDLNLPASCEGELKERARQFRRNDPFPNIPPALLSTHEILDYDRLTGMTGTLEGIRPEHIKAASLELFVGGQYVYWKGKKKIEGEIEAKQAHLRLPANSIVFVQTRNVIRLPEYIAMRFNLRITHVHRGLLLGTGPLVDPGFEGRLLIPLHNLTSTDYLLDVSKALVWAEFTKTSAHHERWSHDTKPYLPPLKGERTVALLSPDKVNNSPDQYLYKAGGGLPIASSIPSAVRGARRDARRAKRATETIQAWARSFGLLAVLGAVVGIAGIVNTTWNLVQTAGTAASMARDGVVRLEKEVKDGVAALDQSRDDVQKSREEVARLEKEVRDGAAALNRTRDDVGMGKSRIDELEQSLAVAVTNIQALQRQTSAAPSQVLPRASRPRPPAASRGRRGRGRGAAADTR